MDQAIAQVAASQFGLVTRQQLGQLGVGPEAIASRRRLGRLHPVHRGVYLVGHAARTRRATELAATLAAGEGAVLSHASAAWFWQLLPYPARAHEAHVTLPGRRRRRRPGLVVHSCALPRSEYCIRDGIPVTQVPRTLLDLATQVAQDELEAAVNEAYARRRCARPQLEAVIARHPNRAGTVALGRAVGLRMTRSGCERRLFRAIRSSDLPPPQTNARVGGYEVDLLWPDRGLVVEVDAWSTHGSRRAFERDRRRDARLAAMGMTVVRIPAHDEPARAVEAIRAAYVALTPRRRADSA